MNVLHLNDIVHNHAELYKYLRDNVIWDESMRARKTASFGYPYNYSQIVIQKQKFLPI